MAARLPDDGKNEFLILRSSLLPNRLFKSPLRHGLPHHNWRNRKSNRHLRREFFKRQRLRHLDVGKSVRYQQIQFDYFKTGRANLVDGSFLAEDPYLELAVVLWMPSMGHGSSPVTIERLDRGTYRVSEVFFTMAGDWEIRVQLKAGNDVKSEAILPLSL